MGLDVHFPPFTRRLALLGTGSGLAALTAVVSRGMGGGFARFLPTLPGNFSALAVPVVSLFALVGPTGLTFPCWAVESSSPGAKFLRWARRTPRR
jgi:hypothetical protein